MESNPTSKLPKQTNEIHKFKANNGSGSHFCHTTDTHSQFRGSNVLMVPCNLLTARIVLSESTVDIFSLLGAFPFMGGSNPCLILASR